MAGSAGSELAPQADEQRLEGELRAQVELLHLAPERAHVLRGPLRAEEPLPRPVLLDLGEPVDVDDRLARARARDHEIPIPRRELLEGREQLLPLRPEGR